MLTDGEIIDLFFERSEEAIFELSAKYDKICVKVAYNILGNKEDTEECVNDAYLGVWNTIPPTRPDPLLSFLLKIVRNISINRIHFKSRQKRSKVFEECLHELERQTPSTISVEDQYDASQITVYINEFLENVEKTNQMLFVRRYWYFDSYEELSEITGLSEGAIRTRLSRMREKLREFMLSKGVMI